MSRYSKIIFVSTDGNCRSLWAAAIFNKEKHSGIIGQSRGQVVLFPEPANPKGVAIAKSKGLSIENESATALRDVDFGEEVLILVMTEILKKNIYDSMVNAVNVYTIREFTGEAMDVEASYGGELVDYGEKFEYLYKLVKIVINKVESDDKTEI